MFYCDECRKKKGWPEGLRGSRGRCEVCGDGAVCHDVPSHAIPLPKPVPCKTCGEPTTMMGTKLCDGCWEVESRLEKYLESEKGREHVVRRLKECDAVFKW